MFTPKPSFSAKKKRVQTPMTASRWSMGLFGGSSKTPAKPANESAAAAMDNNPSNNESDTRGFSVGIAAPSPWRKPVVRSYYPRQQQQQQQPVDLLLSDHRTAARPEQQSIVPASAAANINTAMTTLPSKNRAHAKVAISLAWSSRGTNARKRRGDNAAAAAFTKRIIAASKEIANPTNNLPENPSFLQLGLPLNPSMSRVYGTKRFKSSHFHEPGEEQDNTGTAGDSTSKANQDGSVEESFDPNGPFVFRKLERPIASRATGILPHGAMPLVAAPDETVLSKNVVGLSIPPPTIAEVSRKDTATNKTEVKFDRTPAKRWACDSCGTMNSDEDAECIKCNTRREFEMSPGGWGNMFKGMNDGKWKCSACMCMVEEKLDRCPSCDTPKGQSGNSVPNAHSSATGNSSAPAPAPSAGASFSFLSGGSSVQADAASKVSFGFGSQTAAAPASQETKSAAPGGASAISFGFGAPPAGNAAAPSATAASSQKSAPFAFGAPSTVNAKGPSASSPKADEEKKSDPPAVAGFPSTGFAFENGTANSSSSTAPASATPKPAPTSQTTFSYANGGAAATVQSSPKFGYFGAQPGESKAESGGSTTPKMNVSGSATVPFPPFPQSRSRDNDDEEGSRKKKRRGRDEDGDASTPTNGTRNASNVFMGSTQNAPESASTGAPKPFSFSTESVGATPGATAEESKPPFPFGGEPQTNASAPSTSASTFGGFGTSNSMAKTPAAPAPATPKTPAPPGRAAFPPAASTAPSDATPAFPGVSSTAPAPGTGTSASGAPSKPYAFGESASSKPATPSFGTNPPTGANPFGAPTPSAAPPASSIPFGSGPSSSAALPPFAASTSGSSGPPFGTTPAPSAPMFAPAPSTNTPLFGQTPAFGQPPAPTNPAFGPSPASSQNANPFGTAPTQPSTSGFGAPPSAGFQFLGGQNASTPSTFGTTNAQPFAAAPGPFGQPAASVPPPAGFSGGAAMPPANAFGANPAAPPGGFNLGQTTAKPNRRRIVRARRPVR